MEEEKKKNTFSELERMKRKCKITDNMQLKELQAEKEQLQVLLARAHKSLEEGNTRLKNAIQRKDMMEISTASAIIDSASQMVKETDKKLASV